MLWYRGSQGTIRSYLAAMESSVCTASYVVDALGSLNDSLFPVIAASVHKELRIYSHIGFEQVIIRGESQYR
jgi:hypothetical protein